MTRSKQEYIFFTERVFSLVGSRRPSLIIIFRREILWTMVNSYGNRDYKRDWIIREIHDQGLLKFVRLRKREIFEVKPSVENRKLFYSRTTTLDTPKYVTIYNNNRHNDHLFRLSCLQGTFYCSGSLFLLNFLEVGRKLLGKLASISK